MSRIITLVICALLLTMSFALSVDVPDPLDDEIIPQSTGSSQQQIGAFNGSVPSAANLHTFRLDIDYDSCVSIASQSVSPRVQDYGQAEDGTYFVLATANTNLILINGDTVNQYETLLMNFDRTGSCLSAAGYSHEVWSSYPSRFTPTASESWHTSGAHTLIILDSNWLIVAGTLGYEDYPYSSWGGVVNSSSSWPNGQDGEHIFLAKISRSNFSIADWEVIPTWVHSPQSNSHGVRTGIYAQTFSNSTEFAIAIHLFYNGGLNGPQARMSIVGNTYSSHWSGGSSYTQHTEHTNILARFDHNLTAIESSEIPSPHTMDGNIHFLESGTIVALTGSSGSDTDVVAQYRLPGQNWNAVDLNQENCEAERTSILALSGDRFGWLCVTTSSTLPHDLILSIVNTTSGNHVQYDLGNLTQNGMHLLLGGAFALTEDRIVAHLTMSSYDYTTPSGQTWTGSFSIHCEISTLNVTVAAGVLGSNTPFKGDGIGTSPVRFSHQSSSNSVDVFIGESLMFQSHTTYFRIYDLDQDNDHVSNPLDAFPFDSTQQEDADGDGFGDNPVGNQPDECPYLSGNSSIDLLGCPDNDGDGYSNQGDVFQNDPSQYSDFDSDGYGDNLTGLFGDSCPSTFGESTRDRYGCPDADFDGWSDENDVFPNDSSQWTDWDGDGYGDQLIGFEGDACPAASGNSTEDRYGCTDSDGDGWSDEGDDLPSNPTQWEDRDGDGYGDNASGTMADKFPSDGTQWNDTDGDGHGDNPYGSEGDWFPNNPDRWQDSDRDGVADEDDAFVNDATQWNDTDGDGHGDELGGNQGDTYPNDPNEWQDSDDDGVGNNADAFPFDPSQQTDSDGDGMGDNPMGVGADKFPNDPTQWGDIDGDGYGDNPSGTNPDAFIADPTQHADSDGDGYGDSLSGRLPDMFPNDPTQWLDQDEDGFGDNQSGNNPDPYLFDFDNDGYNDSIDILPKLSSPGDHDNDGCPDEEDVFPLDYKECTDFDGDGEGDNADTDDDNDGWTDTDEEREGTDPKDAGDEPVDSFEIVLPGTAIGLGAWDLIGIFGGVPIFSWILFGFVTRNRRAAKFERELFAARSKEELEEIAIRSEYALMLRMIGAHQGIRLERLRAELDDALDAEGMPITEDQTNVVEQQMVIDGPSGPAKDASGTIAADGYEWIKHEGQDYFRAPNSDADWQSWDN